MLNHVGVCALMHVYGCMRTCIRLYSNVSVRMRLHVHMRGCVCVCVRA